MVYAFDPAARGHVPLELMKDAAERYGYIVAGSNNSRNGDWKLELEAAQAMLEDTHRRLAIDDRRLYFAGFSGGARVASAIAEICKCAAGVMLNGAGFPTQTPPSRSVVFAVYAAVGEVDFNYPEVMELDEKLQQEGFPHWLRHFDGGHDWAPARVMEEGLAWLRLMAMKQGRESPDARFVSALRDAGMDRARSLEGAGDIYAAWQEYRQLARTFEGLGDAGLLQARAAALAKDKAVRDGVKREKQDFAEQERLTEHISAGLGALRENSPERAEIRAQTEQQIIALRELAKSERHAEEQRVLHRALSGTLVEAMAEGENCLEAKDAKRAKDYFELAAQADPGSSWALRSVAQARALSGDRKGTMEALRRAKEKSKDDAAFARWLKEEPAFDKMRDDPQFLALAGNP